MKQTRRVDAEFGPRLRALREALGWTQEQLAYRSGLRRTEISTLEQGRNRGRSLRVRTWLASGLGLSHEALEPYWTGDVPLEEVLAQINKAGVTSGSTQLRGAATPTTRGTYQMANVSERQPNLYVAARLLSTDLGIDELATSRALRRVSAAYDDHADRPTLQWVRLLEAELDHEPTAEYDARAVPALHTAVALVLEDRASLERAVVEAAAARLLASGTDANRVSVVGWVHALERELDSTAAPEAAPRLGTTRGDPVKGPT